MYGICFSTWFQLKMYRNVGPTEQGMIFASNLTCKNCGHGRQQQKTIFWEEEVTGLHCGLCMHRLRCDSYKKKVYFTPHNGILLCRYFFFHSCMNPAFLHKTLQTPAQVHLAENAITVLGTQFER